MSKANNNKCKLVCRLCGRELKGDMDDAMSHLMIEHDAEPNEDFIIDK